MERSSKKESEADREWERDRVRRREREAGREWEREIEWQRGSRTVYECRVGCEIGYLITMPSQIHTHTHANKHTH